MYKLGTKGGVNQSLKGGLSMSKIRFMINNESMSAAEGKTILEVCKEIGINIPTLCYHPDLEPAAVCNMCLVELEGQEELVKSCETKVKAGMVIKTETDKVVAARKERLNEILKTHPNDCLTCIRVGGDCELQNLAYYYDVNPKERTIKSRGLDISSHAIVRDMDKCIACERCIRVCDDVQGIGVYTKVENDKGTYITTKSDVAIAETDCINCGQCVKVCPVGALTEKDEVHKVLAALSDPNKHIVVQMAPAIKNTIGEEFGLAPGTDITGKIPTALRLIGVDKVFDTDFSADLTIMEEGTEFLNRMKAGENLPLITSCSPGWIKFVEQSYPELLDNVSSCKSPQQMFGALVKSYYAETVGVDPKDIFHLSLMPCTAKKFEANRPEMSQNGIQDVDVVLTTRETARLFKIKGIDLPSLEDENFDLLMGEGTGAGRIFANSGGVMEAALRTVVWILTEGEMDAIDYIEVRGLEGVKEAELDVAGTKVKIAIASGTGNAKKILDKVIAGEAEYHFIEIMGCPAGCIGGGGAPLPDNQETKRLRMEGIYASDAGNPTRRSHENTQVQKIYEDYLGQAGSEKAHSLLHTHYVDRSKKITSTTM